jgi:hypothetical protein
MYKLYKRFYLKLHGWKQGWSNEDWLLKDKKYSNPDMAGRSTEEAYYYQKKIRENKL